MMPLRMGLFVDYGSGYSTIDEIVRYCEWMALFH